MRILPEIAPTAAAWRPRPIAPTLIWRMTALLRRTASLMVALAAACCYLSSAVPAHAQHPNVARGLNPSGMFDVGGLDVVNGFNGNLTIRIPLGQSFPVGGLMGSYSFSLVYNSNVWSHVVIDNGDSGSTSPADGDHNSRIQTLRV